MEKRILLTGLAAFAFAAGLQAADADKKSDADKEKEWSDRLQRIDLAPATQKEIRAEDINRLRTYREVTGKDYKPSLQEDYYSTEKITPLMISADCLMFFLPYFPHFKTL